MRATGRKIGNHANKKIPNKIKLGLLIGLVYGFNFDGLHLKYKLALEDLIKYLKQQFFGPNL